MDPRATILVVGLAACGGGGATTPQSSTGPEPGHVGSEAPTGELADLRAALEAAAAPATRAILTAQLGDELWRRACANQTEGLCLATVRREGAHTCELGSTPVTAGETRVGDDAEEAG